MRLHQILPLALLVLVSSAWAAAPSKESLSATLAAYDQAQGRRAKELEAIHQATLAVGAAEAKPGALSAWWFPELRKRAAAAENPEVRFALETQLRLDSSVATSSPKADDPVKPVPYEPGKGDLASVVDSLRSVELGQRPALAPDRILALARGPDAEVAERALYLLRRTSPDLAAPVIWEKLAATKRRSEALALEEELLRLPLASLAKGFVPKPTDAWSRPSRAAWLRVISSRPSLRADKETVFALLKGPADELTEAAWDSVPRVFTAADRGRLTEASKGLSERLAPRAKDALAALR